MKTKLVIILLITLSITNFQLSAVFAQGALTPPGTPAPTMKSLDQIEPRTPISFAPFIINTPGSYYLTTNLTLASGSAIIINANGVVLDLNGFTLAGNISYAGISCANGVQSVRVFNGNLTGWYNGMDASGAAGVTFENIKARGNVFYGLTAGKDAQFFRCLVVSNAYGINFASNGRVADCVAESNTYGIYAGDKPYTIVVLLHTFVTLKYPTS